LPKGADFALLSTTYQLRIVRLNQQLAAIITADGKESGLPEGLWRPLAELVTKGAAEGDVRAKLKECEGHIAEYFKSEAASSAAAIPLSKEAVQQAAWELGGAMMAAVLTRLLGKNPDKHKLL
jgi:hypothetical protein